MKYPPQILPPASSTFVKAGPMTLLLLTFAPCIANINPKHYWALHHFMCIMQVSGIKR